MLFRHLTWLLAQDTITQFYSNVAVLVNISNLVHLIFLISTHQSNTEVQAHIKRPVIPLTIG